MRRIATVVEGHGEVEAVPVLLRRIAIARRGWRRDSWRAPSGRGRALRRGALDPPDDPEAVRDAKGWLGARMPPGRRYRETLHRASFSNMLDLDLARAAPSFDKLWRDVGSPIGAAG